MSAFLFFVFLGATAINFGVLYALFQFAARQAKKTVSPDLPVIRTRAPYINFVVLAVLLSGLDVLVLSFLRPR
jgi:hypothetical protein